MADNYETKFRTIVNDKFPVKATVDAVLSNQSFAVTLAAASKSNVACLVFKPMPSPPPVTDRDVTEDFSQGLSARAS